MAGQVTDPRAPAERPGKLPAALRASAEFKTHEYDAGGRMAVQLGDPGCAPFAGGDAGAATDSEVRAAFDGYLKAAHPPAADALRAGHEDPLGLRDPTGPECPSRGPRPALKPAAAPA